MLKTINRNNKGAVMAEAALSIPILLAIAFFIVEFGNVLYLFNSLNQISRSAARYAAVTPSYTTQQLIDNSGAVSLVPDVSKLSLNINPQVGAAKSVGSTITVTTGYSYTPIINPFNLLNSNQSWMPVIMSSSVIRAEVANAP